MTEQALATADVDSAAGPTDKDLKKVTELAREQVRLQLQIAQVEKELERLKGLLKKNMETDLVTAMDAVGIEGLPLSGGFSIAIETAVQASITEEHKPAAFKYLHDTKNEDLIKREIKISFGKDEIKWAAKFISDCAKRKKPLKLKTKDWVDPQTLKAWVRRLRAKAIEQNLNPDEAVPKDLFGVFVQRYAEVNPPKEKKTGL